MSHFVHLDGRSGVVQDTHMQNLNDHPIGGVLVFLFIALSIGVVYWLDHAPCGAGGLMQCVFGYVSTDRCLGYGP